jgi:hypothetical protein
LRRQGTGEQRNAAGEAGFERLPKDRETLGQLHAIDPELHIGMIAAHMDLTKTVLRNARHLQQDLVKGRVFALRNRLQRLRPKIISAGAKARLYLQAGDIELFGDDFHRIEGDLARAAISRRFWRGIFG